MGSQVFAGAAPAFHQVGAHGGPIRDGEWVRIAALDGAILRLEIAQ